MQRVFVLDTNRQPLMPCTPARARELLDKGKAAVLRFYPFTIILKYAVEANNQPIAAKIDPGSKTTGFALVADFKRGLCCIWAANLEHRGQQIRDALLSRRQIRRGRRGRKTRYRKPRFLNHTRPAGWLPPSLESRIDNIMTWLARLCRFSPIMSLSQELVRFDTQLMQNPEISGIEYQQGELQGYEAREYLLEKWKRQCAYCGIKDVPLQVEHIVPKDRGGSNRVSNLTIACEPCNLAKGTQTAEEFGFPNIQVQAKQPLKDAAAINATRWKLFEWLKSTGLPLETGTGGRTKFNRVQQHYPKDHWIDAACIGETGQNVLVSNITPLQIKAVGRQSRQMCRVDKYGFPRTKTKQSRFAKGFQTGDIVKAIVTGGKNTGTHIGRVAIRSTGSFRIGTTDGISWRFCQIVHKSDGYTYLTKGAAHSSP